MKQLFNDYDEKGKHGMKQSGDFLLNDFYNGDFGLGKPKNSSPFDYAP